MIGETATFLLALFGFIALMGVAFFLGMVYGVRTTAKGIKALADSGKISPEVKAMVVESVRNAPFQ